MEDLSTAAGETAATGSFATPVLDWARVAGDGARDGFSALGLDGLPLVAIALGCAVAALIPLAARRPLLAIVGLVFAGATLFAATGGGANALLIAALCALGTLAAVLAVLTEKRRLRDAQALLQENERALERARNELRAERFWRHASGDGRREIPSQELLELARKTEAGIRESDSAIAA